jgi:histidinol dehydrogenase
VRYDKTSVRAGNRVVAAFAAMERLDAHGRSVAVRTGKTSK